MLRQRVATFSSDTTYDPQWIVTTASFNHQFPRIFWDYVTPYVFLIGGFEIYKNASPAPDTRYVSEYQAFTGGIRLRFGLGSGFFETGGDVLFSTTQGVSKFFVQGDIRMWVAADVALGAGYWVDTAKQAATGFRETSVALETYVRVVF
jgi:hypothetical protein